MKIAVLLGAFSLGPRPLDVATAYTSQRGLTGTELAFLRVSEELTALGHHVARFLGDARPLSVWSTYGYDAILNFNEPNLFRGIKGPRRVLYQMLNDFSFVQPGFDEWVDQYVGVCEQHADHVAQHPSCPTPRSKWKVVPLGCDPELYEDKRVPGRVIHTSCLTRGAHWLLEMWPEIKRAVPEAHLRIFYPWNYDGLEKYYPGMVDNLGPIHPHVLEMAQRIRYIKKALPLLKPLGVEYVGATSRNDMIREYSEASVFAFPCDTVAFSEGFSCSTLEAHASYTIPVITDCDCLGGIYRNSGCSMCSLRSGRFVERVVAGLTCVPTQIDECREFALRHTWRDTARKLEAILQSP